MVRLKLVEILITGNMTTSATKVEWTAEALDAFMLAPETTMSVYRAAVPTDLRFGYQMSENGVLTSVRELN